MTQTAQKKNCSKVSFTSGHRPTLTAFSSGTTSLMFKLNYPTFSPHSLFPWLSGLQVPRPVQPCVPGTEVTHFGSVPRDVKAVRACRGMTRQGGRPRQGISRHTLTRLLWHQRKFCFLGCVESGGPLWEAGWDIAEDFTVHSLSTPSQPEQPGGWPQAIDRASTSIK